MSKTNQIVTVFGGSGFIGRYVCAELAKAGYMVKLVSRDPERARMVKTAGAVGQVTLVPGSVLDTASIERAVENAYAVVNLVGILFERGRQQFMAIHAQGAERVAKTAKAAGANRLVHMSALGVEKAKKSKYARSKFTGEKAVLAAFPTATIVRPSIVFGPEDNFFNLFAKLTKFSPIMPVIGGSTKFEPIYAGDVAQSIAKILQTPETQSYVYELGGPKTYSFKELMQFIARTIHKKPLFVPMPFSAATVVATLAQLAALLTMQKPLLTADQVKLLEVDNIVDGRTGHTIRDLGIYPRSIEDIVPQYLARYR